MNINKWVLDNSKIHYSSRLGLDSVDVVNQKDFNFEKGTSAILSKLLTQKKALT